MDKIKAAQSLFGIKNKLAKVSRRRKPGKLLAFTASRGKPAHPSSYWDPKALKEASLQGELSREKLVWMSPDQFLKLAYPFEKGITPSPKQLENVRNLLRKGVGLNEIPYLKFAYDPKKGIAQAMDHEGRHRALVLKELGVPRMPVKLWSSQNTYLEYPNSASEVIRWGAQKDKAHRDRITGEWPKLLKPELPEYQGHPERLSRTKAQYPFPVQDPSLTREERIRRLRRRGNKPGVGTRPVASEGQNRLFQVMFGEDHPDYVPPALIQAVLRMLQ